MIYDFLSPCYYSVALYDYQFCITIAFRLLSTRLVRVLLFCLSLSRHSRTLCMHFIGVLWVFRPVFLSCFIAVMQMRVCKDRMALGLYL